jgi:hypothetical protein
MRHQRGTPSRIQSHALEVVAGSPIQAAYIACMLGQRFGDTIKLQREQMQWFAEHVVILFVEGKMADLSSPDVESDFVIYTDAGEGAGTGT